jgi:cytochrome c oxidase subunit II
MRKVSISRNLLLPLAMLSGRIGICSEQASDGTPTLTLPRSTGRGKNWSSVLSIFLPFVGVCAAVLLTGCAADLHSSESALDPAGVQAHHISKLIWGFGGLCVVVYVLVMIVLLGALVHRRRGQTATGDDTPITAPDPEREGRIWTVVFSSIVITVVTLFVLLFSDFATGRAIHHLSDSPEPLRIQVIGHQWWWEVRYLDWPARFGERVPSNDITSANEIHIPVDPNHPVAVQCKLDSHDVIHSFWVPSLHGKKDLVPGHPTDIWIEADKPGIYWGDCGEYCGYQHAQMRIAVVAEPVEKFQRWLDAQRQSAAEPANYMQTLGKNVFLHSSCPMCHAIQGTTASGMVGPDLTHVASRQLLAAGAIPNAPGHLAGWIVDPQKIKPGARMPQNNLSPQDLRALLEYLESLK